MLFALIVLYVLGAAVVFAMWMHEGRRIGLSRKPRYILLEALLAVTWPLYGFGLLVWHAVARLGDWLDSDPR